MFAIFDVTLPLTATIVMTSVVIMVAIALSNYLMLAVPAYFYFQRNSGTRSIPLQSRSPFKGQIKHEIVWSLSTILIYSCLSIGLIVAWRYGLFPNLYLEPLEYGWAYLILSFFLVLLVQDVYFYFSHRLLHTRKLIRYHGIHHRSKTPTPFVMYTFHPVEALVHFVRIPLMLWLFPVHPLVLLLAEGMVSNMVNTMSHANHEPGFLRPWRRIHGWMTRTNIFHDLHHEKVKGNYGFYLTFWDRLFKTYLADTPKQVDELKLQYQSTALNKTA